ncbi:MAG: WG repeat-containing protein [Chitinophagales bacterium]|nr:WG repeat-containing protein [Chitinophagales bacterium]MDW8428315.1 WG repeat-containing protein [Chitinophagales bacterium]
MLQGRNFLVLLLWLAAEGIGAQDLSTINVPEVHPSAGDHRTYGEKSKEKAEPLNSYYKLHRFLNEPTCLLDSAFFYLDRTLSLLQQPMKPRQQRQLLSAGCEPQALLQIRHRLLRQAYEQTLSENTSEAWSRFLKYCGSCEWKTVALSRRDEALFLEVLLRANYDSFEELVADYPQLHHVANARQRFEQAHYQRYTADGSAAAYQRYAQCFPERIYATEARSIYEQKLFDECVRLRSAEAYALFLQQHPYSPFAAQAEDSLYRLYTRDNKVSSYLQFISQFPNSRYVYRAWQQIFALEVPVRKPQAIETFLKKYPNYPYTKELRTEARLLYQKFYTYKRHGLIGYVSLKTRDTIIPARFREASLFSEGLAAVRLDCEQEPCPYAYVTLSGRLIDTYPWSRAGDFSNGRAVAAVGSGQDVRYGIINHAGEWVVPPSFTEIHNYNEGLALVKTTHYGFVDESGNIVIPCIYPKAVTFSEGLAAAQDPNTGLFGYLDRQNRWVIPPKFTNAAGFREQLAAAADESGRWGYIDKQGKWIITPAYELALPFINGKASVMVKEQKRVGSEVSPVKPMVIDRQGRRIAP